MQPEKIYFLFYRLCLFAEFAEVTFKYFLLDFVYGFFNFLIFLFFVTFEKGTTTIPPKSPPGLKMEFLKACECCEWSYPSSIQVVLQSGH